MKPASIALLVVLVATALVYLPGLSGGFAFDDYPNIMTNTSVSEATLDIDDLAQAAWSGAAGPLRRPIAMVSFALNYATSGDAPLPFKLTNLIIHLVNGVLVFWFARLLLSVAPRARAESAAAIALIASAIWLLHPINVTSVLYVVQRMNSLAAMFSLLALICFVSGRVRIRDGARGGNTLLYGGTTLGCALGVLCKENAILVIPLAGLIELCFFKLTAHTTRDRMTLLGVFMLVLIIPALIATAYLIAHPRWLPQLYGARPFSLAERLLTEARVLWFYLHMIVMPRLGELGLFHDDFQLSQSLVEPISTLPAAAGIAILGVTAVAAWRRFPMFTFAVLWFLIAHLLESSIFPIELVYEHRNYFPGVGLILGLVYAAAKASSMTSSRKLPFALALVVVAMMGSMTYLRAGEWGDPTMLALLEAARHPRSHRAVYEAGGANYDLYVATGDHRYYQMALTNLERSIDLDPRAKRALFALMKLAYTHGDPPDPAHKAELIRRLKETQFHHSEWTELHTLVMCHARGKCSFPQSVVIELFDAALANPTASPYARAHMLVDLAVFNLNELNDPGRAVELLDAAVEIKPKEFRYRLTRAQVMLLAGLFDRVGVEIASMRNVKIWDDQIRTPVEKIDALEADLHAKQLSVSD